ncbi:MAG: RagB/SusD family nutrient uptake outer membrane protein [Saprospiraceae bacterium]|nr:RagB/SusD family nutrient uptake outer membrane protein [Saprospiraceae bacterium]
MATIAVACSDEFLEQPPLGAISLDQITNKAGVEGSLIVAYRGLGGSNIASWYTSPMNWLWGGIRSDDAYKGTEAADQGTEINPVESFKVQPNSPSVNSKWRACYDGIGTANIVLRQVVLAKDISAEDVKRITAEARFLRGYHHFEAVRCFNKVPYVDEKALESEDFKAFKNDVSIWPQIEADLKFAYDNLPNTFTDKGRVNKWAAGSFLAKAYMTQGKFAEAKPLFDAIIANGVTNSNEKYGLLPEYKDIFRGQFENSREIIFSVQYTVGDGTGGANSNKDGELTNPHNDGPVGCCGFYQPAQSLVNAFRTQNGLPLIKTYNNVDIKNHESNPTDFKDNSEVDPRLDYTVGRVGIPYKDFGPAKASWIRNLANGGPFMPNKNIQWKDEVGAFWIAGGWGQGQLGKNQIMMRFADLLLMAAEAEVEVGSLAKAQEYVNLVRDRAAKSTVVKLDSVPAANYKISTYTTTWANKNDARDAVRFERYIELGMEGHRFL